MAAPAGEAEAAWTAERIPDEVQSGTAQQGGAASRCWRSCCKTRRSWPTTCRC